MTEKLLFQEALRIRVNTISAHAWSLD